jgi:hypothetical protein
MITKHLYDIFLRHLQNLGAIVVIYKHPMLPMVRIHMNMMQPSYIKSSLNFCGLARAMEILVIGLVLSIIKLA